MKATAKASRVHLPLKDKERKHLYIVEDGASLSSTDQRWKPNTDKNGTVNMNQQSMITTATAADGTVPKKLESCEQILTLIASRSGTGLQLMVQLPMTQV